MKKIAILGLVLGSAFMGVEYAGAAPLFSVGTDNVLGFQAVGNKTGSSSTPAVGDKFYGVANIQDNSTGSGIIWNAQNVTSPYDSFSGYFVVEIMSVATTTIGSGTLYSVEMGAASSDPNGIMTAADIAAGTIMKLYTDSGTSFTTAGSVANGISRATDGTLWASLGITSAGGGYWDVSLAPPGISSGTMGGINFITNSTGFNWSKVADPNPKCTGGGCDMTFNSTFSTLPAGGTWQFRINDPATIHPVPLPAAAWLLGSGLIGLAGLARRKFHK